MDPERGRPIPLNEGLIEASKGLFIDFYRSSSETGRRILDGLSQGGSNLVTYQISYPDGNNGRFLEFVGHGGKKELMLSIFENLGTSGSSIEWSLKMFDRSKSSPAPDIVCTWEGNNEEEEGVLRTKKLLIDIPGAVLFEAKNGYLTASCAGGDEHDRKVIYSVQEGYTDSSQLKEEMPGIFLSGDMGVNLPGIDITNFSLPEIYTDYFGYRKLELHMKLARGRCANKHLEVPYSPTINLQDLEGFYRV